MEANLHQQFHKTINIYKIQVKKVQGHHLKKCGALRNIATGLVPSFVAIYHRSFCYLPLFAANCSASRHYVWLIVIVCCNLSFVMSTRSSAKELHKAWYTLTCKRQLSFCQGGSGARPPIQVGLEASRSICSNISSRAAGRWLHFSISDRKEKNIAMTISTISMSQNRIGQGESG